ncbi:MAG: Asp-tRNA(Asn)/Glu-tRNA(Gln) amidotransferase subunit GatB [Chitinophagaceae bacterium]|nr:Asp-tRNA(Asn)/Glu-tRNA(Gln) amidotransferase subunit GatB [Chitinophagaceae bacterium]MCZ2396503.1 Asp-tRNA(Asn)/Glu-tRNA(Gln) amidotransferase subunit GatB [Chitinophagales bacterium]
MPQNGFDTVIGLEIHAQLLTKSKLFCGDSTVFGDTPNSHVSAVSLAHPGTLPVLNKEAVKLAIKLGVALDCTINQYNYFARKHYFYPDLPNGYQISQNAAPICVGGAIPIVTAAGIRHIALNRIHLENDAGKSIHDADPENTLIDLNRAGTALVEIVTEPVISSPEEASACLAMVRSIVRHLGVCDGNMEEGSLRCDVNISVRKKGDSRLGTKVEIKNLNSVRNVKRAATYEEARLTRMIENGEEVLQQTRNFDADTGITTALRTKEEANDYRYFPDPDLPPIIVTSEEIEEIRKSLPLLPHEIAQQLTHKYGLGQEASSIISGDDLLYHLFESASMLTGQHAALANWLIGPLKSLINEKGASSIEGITAPKLVSLAELTAQNSVSFANAAAKILPEMLSGNEDDALTIARKLNLLQVNDTDALNEWIDQVLARFPEKVLEYQKGKKSLTGFFAGEVKKLSKGKADIKSAMEILSQKLNKQ